VVRGCTWSLTILNLADWIISKKLIPQLSVKRFLLGSLFTSRSQGFFLCGDHASAFSLYPLDVFSLLRMYRLRVALFFLALSRKCSISSGSTSTVSIVRFAMLQMYDNIAVLQMCENNFLNYLHCTTNVLPLTQRLTQTP
jgi:hypothetical protein